MNATTVLTKPAAWARRTADTYRGSEQRPLRGYVATLGAYAGLVSALTALARRTGRTPPERITPWDVVLFGVATHKLSRLIAKDPVTSPVRAPFTRYRGVQGPAELAEEVRHGTDVEHALGELVSCPFCLSQWIATGFSAGWLFAPRTTKLVASTFASVATADFLQFGYAALQQHT